MKLDRCLGTTRKGAPCEAGPHLVDPESGYCIAHDPAKKELLREAGRRGGRARARKYDQTGLDPEDLGGLESIDDVRRWLEQIGQAVASGKLDHKAAAGALKAAEIATKILQTASREEIADLRSELQRVRKVKAVR